MVKQYTKFHFKVCLHSKMTWHFPLPIFSSISLELSCSKNYQPPILNALL